MQHVIYSTLKEFFDVLVIQGIIYLPALFLGTYQVHLAQAAHVVRDTRWTDAHCIGQCLDIHGSIQ
jgi:uncharacterized membrane protein SpoIIM required for sporulation